MRKIGMIAALLVFCISGAAFAQDATPAFCGTLSQADCTILQKAQDNTKTLDSESFAMTLDVNATNVPNMAEPVTFSLTGNGSVSGTSKIQGEMATAQSNPGQYLQDLLTNVDADLNLTATLPTAMTQMDPSVPSSINLQIRLADGVGYVNTDTLQPLLAASGSASSLKGWYGLDLAGLFKAAIQANPDMFSNMMSSSSSADSMAMMQQFQDPAMMGQFVQITRTDDGSGTTATFQFTVDLGALMNTPQFQQMMQKQMNAQGQTMSQAEMDQSMSMAAAMFKQSSIVITEDVGTDDGFVHDIKGTLKFDTSAMMAMMPTEDATTDAAATPQVAPNINVDFSITYSNFNSAPAITAPTGATVIPYQSLLSAMSSEMGSMSSSLSTDEAPMEATMEAPMATAEPTTSG